jgi:hypothetical protein
MTNTTTLIPDSVLPTACPLSPSLSPVQCYTTTTVHQAVMFSGSVTNSVVATSEFVHTGDSAIVLIGLSDAIDGTKPTYPNNNIIKNNHIREIGVHGARGWTELLCSRAVICGCYSGWSPHTCTCDSIARLSGLPSLSANTP